MSVEYNELMNMCGLDDEWQAANKERIENFLHRIYVRTKEDMDHAMKHFTYQFDTSLAGVRACLAVLMKETIDFVLARDEREIIIQYGRPTMATLAQGFHVAENRINKELGYDKFYARGTSIVYVEIVLGAIFDKSNWLIEIGEDMGQTAGKGHCSEYQIWEGAIVKGVIPTPDVEIACGVFCDQAPEVECLLADEFDYDIICTDMTQDHNWNTWPNVDPRGVQYESRNTDKMYKYLSDKYDFTITEEDLNQGAAEANAIVGRHMAIVQLMGEADPQPISQCDMCLPFYLFVCGSVYVDETMAAIKQLQKDVRKRIKNSEGVCSKGAPRVYQTFRPVADFRFYKLLEELDIATPVAWFDTFPPEVFNTPPGSERPVEQMYELIYRFCGLGDLSGSLKSWKWICEQYKLDGILLLLTMFCRPSALPIAMAKDYIQKELEDFPALILEMDSFDSRNYTSGQYKTRLESFAEILRMNQAMKGDEEAA